MKICITGGSGFVGSQLAKSFVDAGHTVLILDLRSPRDEIAGVDFRKSNLVDDIPKEDFLSCDAIIHLAGVNIFGRWTEEYKKLILDSRINTARALIATVKESGRGPKVFVSASAVGYYGDGGEAELAESAPNGSDFLATVCRKWEEVARTSETAGMRWVSVRTGIVLGKGGGMLAKLLPIFKWGLGGPMGSGKQWFSWIYMDDLLNVYKTVTLDDTFSGPVNAVSPNPVRNKELAKAIGNTLKRPAFLPVPGFLLKLVMGELGSVVVMSQKVIPQKLTDNKFSFICPTIEKALEKSMGK